MVSTRAVVQPLVAPMGPNRKGHCMSNRKGILFGFATVAGVLAAASVASACVTFMGKMEVEGHDGKTEVVGTGNSHGYCSDGRPTSAAAGHLLDTVEAKVSPGTCADVGALANHQLPDGTYQVRYNNKRSYTFDGTYWNMNPGHGCFNPAQAATSSVLGTFDVVNGSGAWTGQIVPLGEPYYAPLGEASNFCVGAPQLPSTGSGGPPGLLAPFRLLAI